jgi:photosystem II stability/assembly factor-like uncharacterized protein
MKKITIILTAVIAMTITASAQWTQQISGTTNALNSVYFTDTNTGYTVGVSGTILNTNNAGINWVAQSSGTTNILRSVYFTDANTGYAVGNVGKFLKLSILGLIGRHKQAVHLIFYI